MLRLADACKRNAGGQADPRFGIGKQRSGGVGGGSDIRLTEHLGRLAARLGITMSEQRQQRDDGVWIAVASTQAKSPNCMQARWLRPVASRDRRQRLAPRFATVGELELGLQAHALIGMAEQRDHLHRRALAHALLEQPLGLRAQCIFGHHRIIELQHAAAVVRQPFVVAPVGGIEPAIAAEEQPGGERSRDHGVRVGR